MTSCTPPIMQQSQDLRNDEARCSRSDEQRTDCLVREQCHPALINVAALQQLLVRGAVSYILPFDHASAIARVPFAGPAVCAI